METRLSGGDSNAEWELHCLRRAADGGSAASMLQFQLERGGDGTKQR
jgi:hypothetical protein